MQWMRAETDAHRWIGPGRVALGLLAISCLGSLPAHAQTAPDMAALVADWATGRYASPVFCEFDGELVQGIRRVLLRPHLEPGRPTQLTVQFVDMRPGEATRCSNSLGQAQPNVLGKLQLRLPGNPHPETARRDFKQALKRDRGFTLEVAGGRLQLRDVAAPAPLPRVVDFRGGRARLGLILPATDAERELAGFQSPRKLLLELESKDGEALQLPLYLMTDG